MVKKQFIIVSNVNSVFTVKKIILYYGMKMLIFYLGRVTVIY